VKCSADAVPGPGTGTMGFLLLSSPYDQWLQKLDKLFPLDLRVANGGAVRSTAGQWQLE